MHRPYQRRRIALRIDLHTHSTASDGTMSPADVVREAAAVGLDVLALTDHDTTGGWAAAIEALPPGLTFVCGAELSCRIGRTSIHLLGYLFDPAEPTFAAERERVRESRLHRGRRIVDLLAADGYPVTWDEVLGYAAGGTVGRPHIARALMKHGLVSTMDAAFTPEWLATRGRYWAPKEETDAAAAIRLVRGAGGVSVFAHPLATKRGRVVSDDDIAALAAAGLTGLEVDHVDHDASQRAHLRRLAADLSLQVTGSSDFHGESKAVRLGDETTTPEVYEALVAAASGATPVAHSVDR